MVLTSVGSNFLGNRQQALGLPILAAAIACDLVSPVTVR